MAASKFTLNDWLVGFAQSIGGKVAYSLGMTPVDSSGNEYNAANPMPVSAVSAGSANLFTGQISAGTAATKIADARSGRRTILVTNMGTTDVFLGGSSVSAANGQLLAGVKGTTASLEFTGALYAIVASGSQTVSYSELY